MDATTLLLVRLVRYDSHASAVFQTEQIPVTSEDCLPIRAGFARFPGTLNADVMRSFARVVAFPDSKIIVFSCRLNTFGANADLAQVQLSAIKRPITYGLRHVRGPNGVCTSQVGNRSAYL